LLIRPVIVKAEVLEDRADCEPGLKRRGPCGVARRVFLRRLNPIAIDMVFPLVGRCVVT
jgi:hypothetical protein